MRSLILVASLLAAVGAGAAVLEQADLVGGSYTVKLSGLLCTTCAKAAAAEISALEPVQSAKVDFDREELILTVKNGKYLKFSHLRKALRRAAKKVNLGTQFEVESVRYRP